MILKSIFENFEDKLKFIFGKFSKYCISATRKSWMSIKNSDNTAIRVFSRLRCSKIFSENIFLTNSHKMMKISIRFTCEMLFDILDRRLCAIFEELKNHEYLFDFYNQHQKRKFMFIPIE